MSLSLIESRLAQSFEIDVLRSNVRDTNAAKGRWDLEGILRVFSIACRLLWRLLRKRPSLVYLTISQNWSGLARDGLYIFVARALGVPVVGHLHGSALGGFIRGRHPIPRAVITRLLSSLSSLIVLAQSIRNDVQSLLPRLTIDVVYNGITPTEPSVSVREREQPFTVSFMGPLSAAKGFYDLISAAEKVLQVHPRARFEMAGERLDNERNVAMAVSGGGDWKSFESLRARFPDNFHLHGIITGEAKARFLASADVFVLPSYAEAFPVAVLEAMAAGLPLIVTPVGALPEVLKEGINGFFVAAGDSSSIAEKIFRLIESPPLRERIGAENRAAAEKFSVSRMASAVARIFENEQVSRAN
jgi:glycosyltransferase involved in cell wall biosynthesis